MLANLTGKIGLVTGAGSGIGRAVAINLSKCGANVAVLDRDEKSARDTAVFINTRINAAGKGGSAKAFAVDVTDEKQVQEAVEQSAQLLEGDLTHAVHCAGILMDGWMMKMRLDDWKKVIDVNLTGTFVVTTAVARQIQKNENPQVGGSIVNISSIIGKTGNLGQANYSAAKAGVIGYTKTAAKELAKDNIRVNALLPGFIDTPMVQAVPPKVLNAMIEQIPLKRLGTPEEIANTAIFLCSDFSSFVTGAAIEATGGQSM